MAAVRIGGVLLFALFACSAGLAQDRPARTGGDAGNCGIPASTSDGWQIAPAAGVGFDPALLCQWVEHRLTTPADNVHAVIVVRHGSLVFERYFSGADDSVGKGALGEVVYDRTMQHDMRSISKSVTSLLFGIALEQKKIASLDQPVFDFFPEYADLRTPEKDRITLRHLLTMSTGLAWEEALPFADPKNDETLMTRARDPYRYVLERPLASAPGTKYNYCGGATALLGAILTKKTGQKLDDFARVNLFEPLGIADFEWVKLANGDPAAWAGLRLKPRDLAKIGQLVLNRGRWNGRQIVPAAYVDESTKPQLVGADYVYLYGYQWWLGRSVATGLSIGWLVSAWAGSACSWFRHSISSLSRQQACIRADSKIGRRWKS